MKRKNEQSVNNEKSINRILDIMYRLRNPKTGCQWDLEQDFESLSKYTIEEAYEVADAVLNGKIEEIKEELGDLLLQVVFFSQIAEEHNQFVFSDIVKVVSEKMIRRHPHIFSNKKEFKTADEQKENWESIKDFERKAKENKNQKFVLSGIANNLPSLLKSKKIQEKVSRVGFDFECEKEVIAKVKEELTELIDAINNSDNIQREEELGDLLFTLVNLGRHIDIDCDTALRKANNKFTKRFNLLELKMLKENKELSKSNKLDMEKAWAKVKGSHDRRNGKAKTSIYRG